jgi:hypothetical protein
MIRGHVRIVLMVLATACGGGDTSDGGITSGSDAADVDCGCVRGSYIPVCGVDGKTYDATCGTACVPVGIACPGECPCSDASSEAASDDATSQGDVAEPRNCHVNADCSAGARPIRLYWRDRVNVLWFVGSAVM